jgi:ABC-type anion transport system duplicated permease subunit
MSKKNLYSLFALLCVAGYIWIALTYTFSEAFHSERNFCLFKAITGFPCPACGSTRAVLTLLHGDISGSLWWNPLGVVLVFVLVILPFWLSYDVLKNQKSLYMFYYRMEILLKQRMIALPAIFFILCNWMWNIYKGL